MTPDRLRDYALRIIADDPTFIVDTALRIVIAACAEERRDTLTEAAAVCTGIANGDSCSPRAQRWRTASWCAEAIERLRDQPAQGKGE